MAEPVGSYTFGDLIIRISELVGIADYDTDGTGAAAVPTDAHDLDKCKRCVEDAIKMFIADSPTNGWFWMSRIMSIKFRTDGAGRDNINSDASR